MRTASLSLSRRRSLRRPAATVLAAAALAALSVPAAQAQADAPASTARSFAIPAQPLAQALNELARQANLQMGFAPALVAGKTSAAVSGEFTAQQALDRLLAGSGYTYRFVIAALVVQGRCPYAQQQAQHTVEAGDVGGPPGRSAAQAQLINGDVNCVLGLA